MCETTTPITYYRPPYRQMVRSRVLLLIVIMVARAEARWVDHSISVFPSWKWLQWWSSPLANPDAAAAAAGNVGTVTLAAHLKDLIRRLPKAELHVHIEGTLDTELMWSLAVKNNVSLPYPTITAAKAARENFVDLQDFLDAYNVAMTVLCTEEDFHDLVSSYLDKAAANNITHVEIFFDAQHHIARGIPLATIVNGLQSALDARASHPTAPVDASLILCLVRELGELAAAQTLFRVLTGGMVGKLTALGLASSEVGHPPEDFKDVYRTASLLGLHKVAHAGEEGGPDYVWAALKVLGVERVDHGIRSIEDPILVQYLADTRVPITLCPLSNLRLQVYAGSLEKKIREILSSGIVVTINSDDPAYFGGYLNANYEWVAAIASLSPEDIGLLARNSFAASFIPAEQKLAAYARIRDVLEQWKAEQVGQQQQQLW